MAFYTMAFLGTAPIGSLLAGVVADASARRPRSWSAASACVLAGGWFAWRLPRLREIVRPIYVERGILAAAEIDADLKAL